MSDQTPKGPIWLEFYKANVELIKGLAWPIFIGILLIVFRAPLGRTVDVVVDKLWQASKVGIGGLSIDIQEQARAKGNPELATRLGGLSPEAVRKLIEIGDKQMLLVGGERVGDLLGAPGDQEDTFILDTGELDVLRELADEELIGFSEDLDGFLEWMESAPLDPVRVHLDEGLYEFKAKRSLSYGQRRRLSEQRYEITSLGEEAWEAVLDAIMEQLRATPSTSRGEIAPDPKTE